MPVMRWVHASLLGHHSANRLQTYQMKMMPNLIMVVEYLLRYEECAYELPLSEYQKYPYLAAAKGREW